MAIDNGGAIAQKGFSYQNAVISLVAIRNYKKSNFQIYVEARDDFEVTYDANYHAYIQVKGLSRVSLNKLLAQSKSQAGNLKQSIIEKNLSSGDDDSKYKIVVYNFTKSDLSDMQELETDELFERAYSFSDDQKRKIGNSCSRALSLVVTDFKTDSKAASKFLIGEMQHQNISVDNKADIVLSELWRIISQKSEKEIVTEADRELKKITANELVPILQKVSALEKFDTVLKKFDFNEFRNAKIKKEKAKILLQYSSIKSEVVSEMKQCDLENINETTLVTTLVNSDLLSGLDTDAQYAICISAYCDILEEV